MTRPGIRISLTLGVALIGAAPWSIAAAEMKFHYDCSVTHTEHVPQMGRQGETVEMTHFTCHISGGILEGFVAIGTNLLELHEEGGRLVGSTVVAQKGDSMLAYEVNDAMRRLRKNDGVVRWESTGNGIYKHATGSVAALAGKSFTALVRSAGPRAFTIDTVVSD